MYLSGNHLPAYGSRQTRHPLVATIDVLDIAIAKCIVCPVELSVLTKLWFNHGPIQVHLASRNLIGRGDSWVSEWNRYGPVFGRRIPDLVHWTLSTKSTKFSLRLMRLEGVTFSVEQCPRLKPTLTLDNQTEKSVFLL